MIQAPAFRGKRKAPRPGWTTSACHPTLAIVAGTWVIFERRQGMPQRLLASKTRNSTDAARHSKNHPLQSSIVRVAYDIHSHDASSVLHRYFAVTDDDGRYRIDGVPPGTYSVAVWNETVRGDPPKRTVTIGEGGGDVDADFSIR